MRDDEPRRVWMSPLITHGTCVCVYYCRTYYKTVGAELVGVLVTETIHPACMCEGGGRGGEGGGRAIGPENAVGEWVRRRKGE